MPTKACGLSTYNACRMVSIALSTSVSANDVYTSLITLDLMKIDDGVLIS